MKTSNKEEKEIIFMDIRKAFEDMSGSLSDRLHVIGIHKLESDDMTTTYMDIQGTYGDQSSILSIRADEFTGSNGVGKLAFTLSFPYDRGNLLRVLVPATEVGAEGFMQALRVVLDEITEETFILDEGYPVDTAWCVARLCVKNLVGGVYVMSPDLISSRWFSSTGEAFALENVDLGTVQLNVDLRVYTLNISNRNELVKSFNIKATPVHEMRKFILDCIEESKKDNKEAVLAGDGDGDRAEHCNAVDADDTGGEATSSLPSVEEGETPLLPVADWNTLSEEEARMLYATEHTQYKEELFDIVDDATDVHHLEARFMESVMVTKAGDQKVVLRACSHRRVKDDVTPALQIDILPTRKEQVSLWVSIGDDEKLGKTPPSRRSRALGEEEKSTFDVVHVEMPRYSTVVDIKDMILKIMHAFDQSLRFIDGDCLRKAAHLMAKSIRLYVDGVNARVGNRMIVNVINIDDAMEIVENEVSSIMHASTLVMHDLILRKDRYALFSLHTRSQLGTISIKEDAHLGVRLETLLNDRSLRSHVYPTPNEITSAIKDLITHKMLNKLRQCLLANTPSAIS